jgi:REP element-mobilizing transposase RayT
MGLRFSEQIFGDCFFVTTTFLNWREYGKIVGVYECLADSICHYLEKYDALLPAFVFMPSHLHLLIVIDGKKLGRFIRDFKKFVAQKGIKECGVRDAHIWIPGYDRQAVYSEKVFLTKIEYIHNNPVKSGLSSILAQWEWSSAKYYESEDISPIPI